MFNDVPWRDEVIDHHIKDMVKKWSFSIERKTWIRRRLGRRRDAQISWDIGA